MHPNEIDVVWKFFRKYRFSVSVFFRNNMENIAMIDYKTLKLRLSKGRIPNKIITVAYKAYKIN